MSVVFSPMVIDGVSRCPKIRCIQFLFVDSLIFLQHNELLFVFSGDNTFDLSQIHEKSLCFLKDLIWSRLHCPLFLRREFCC